MYTIHLGCDVLDNHDQVFTVLPVGFSFSSSKFQHLYHAFTHLLRNETEMNTSDLIRFFLRVPSIPMEIFQT